MKKKSTRKLVSIAILASVAAVLMFLEFPLWFAPNFYEMDFSEVPVLIGGFAFGPLAAMAIEAVKVIVRTAIMGTQTMGIGELANFLMGVAFIVPASYIYQINKTRKNAIIGVTVGVVSMAFVSAILNWLVLLPAYAFYLSSPEYTITIADFVSMGSAVNPLVENLATFILFAVVPFNLLKGILTSVVVILIYNRVSLLFKAKDSEAV
jgi:riboflavin transporter FmnP